MQRTIRPKIKQIEIEDISDVLIIIPKAVFDKLLKQEHPSDLISLYSFYYYTAKWQKTNQPKATNKYCQQGLNIGQTRFLRAKATLLEIGLIENVKIHGGGWYIKLTYIIKKKTINKVRTLKTKFLKNTENKDLRKQYTNALSTNNKNALSINNKKTIKKRNEIYFPIGKKLSKIISSNKNITYSTQQLNRWSNDIRILSETNKISIKRMKVVLKWYKINIGAQYTPVVESGASFRDKFIQLESAIQRGKNGSNNIKPINRNGSRAFSNDKIDYSHTSRKN